MRVVCSFVGGAGHLVPQLPLHRALADAGHQLVLVGRESAARSVPDIYQQVIVSDDDRRGVREAIAPLAPVDIEHELAVVERHFAGGMARESAARVASALVGADLLVCDELDLGAMAVAQDAGVPTVVVAVIATGALVRPERLTGAFEALRGDLGTSEVVRPFGDHYVVPFEPSMRFPSRPAPSDALWMRPAPAQHPASDGSIVATLGTEFNSESGDLFDRILAALALIDAPSTLAVGNDLDPRRFGPQPAHVTVERFVDLGMLISRADVVVHHGGSGLFLQSVLGAAPQVVFPMGADQPFTATRVADLNLGSVLDPATATPEAIAETIGQVRASQSIRAAVSALRSQTLALPTADMVVAHLEAGASQRSRGHRQSGKMNG